MNFIKKYIMRLVSMCRGKTSPVTAKDTAIPQRVRLTPLNGPLFPKKVKILCLCKQQELYATCKLMDMGFTQECAKALDGLMAKGENIYDGLERLAVLKDSALRQMPSISPRKITELRAWQHFRKPSGALMASMGADIGRVLSRADRYHRVLTSFAGTNPATPRDPLAQ